MRTQVPPPTAAQALPPVVAGGCLEEASLVVEKCQLARHREMVP